MAPLDCYKCHKSGHFARDCPTRKAHTKSHVLGTTRIRRRKNGQILPQVWALTTLISASLLETSLDLVKSIWPYITSLFWSEPPSTVKNLEGCYSKKFALKHVLTPYEARKVRTELFGVGSKSKSDSCSDLEKSGKILAEILKPRIENYESRYNVKMCTDEVTLILPKGPNLLPNIESRDGITWSSVKEEEKGNECIQLKKEKLFGMGYHYKVYKIPQAQLKLNSLDNGQIIHLDKVEIGGSGNVPSLVAITPIFDDGRTNFLYQFMDYISSFFSTESSLSS